MEVKTKRKTDFQRNEELETLLKELNDVLEPAEKSYLQGQSQFSNFPILFIMGAHRSGTTLFLQWLASTGVFCYPTNIISRFYKAPIIGAKLQLLLTDKRFNYRNEFADLNRDFDFHSSNGKTKGILAPNEFWYFWRRFLEFNEIDYIPTAQLLLETDIKTLRSELIGLTNVFKKPLALKGMILNYNIDFLDQIFRDALFIYIKRDPLKNIASGLEARERQFGTTNQWYSFKIPEYHELVDLPPHEQVAGQIYYINRAIETGLSKVADSKQMTVRHEDFCENPKIIFKTLRQKLLAHGFEMREDYTFAKNFEQSRLEEVNESIRNAYAKFSTPR